MNREGPPPWFQSLFPMASNISNVATLDGDSWQKWHMSHIRTYLFFGVPPRFDVAVQVQPHTPANLPTRHYKHFFFTLPLTAMICQHTFGSAMSVWQWIFVPILRRAAEAAATLNLHKQLVAVVALVEAQHERRIRRHSSKCLAKSWFWKGSFKVETQNLARKALQMFLITHSSKHILVSRTSTCLSTEQGSRMWRTHTNTI